MSLYLSKHERDRVTKQGMGIRSDDIIDFPEHVQLAEGDMLIWNSQGGADGRGYWSGTQHFFGTDICKNYLRIVDVSNNLAVVNAKIDTTAQQVKNEIIGQAPETLDTLKEIADALGDPDNITGNVVNKLTTHDSQITFLQGAKNITDVSVNMLHNQQLVHTGQISNLDTTVQNNQITQGNQITLINNQVNVNTTSIATIQASTTNLTLLNTQHVNKITDNSNNIALNTTNITTNTTGIATINQTLAKTDLSFNSIFSQNTQRITDICGNLARILSNDTDIAALQVKTGANETAINNSNVNINTNTLNITSNDSDINALTTRMNTAEGTLISHTNSINTNLTTGNTNAGNITTLTSLTTSHTGKIAILDASMARVGSIIEPKTNSNLSKINTNINNIATNTTNITTNTTNITNNTTNITNNTNSLNALLNGTGAAGVLDTIKDLADAIGDPNGIGSSVITKLTRLDASMNTVFNEKGSNDTDIANNATNIASNLTLINTKQPLITNESLAMSKVQGLTTALNAKQGTIGVNGLPQANVNGLILALTNKQDVIPDGGLSQVKVANLQTSLAAKQDVILDNSLPQSKVFNLVASLAGKQPTVGNSDLLISHTQGLQAALDAKQPLLGNESLTIATITGLTQALAQKQISLTAGSKITLSNTGTIDTIAATHLDELLDVKTGRNNVEFSNSLLIGTTATGTLASAENNIGIGHLSLSTLSLGKNNIGIGINTLKTTTNKEKSVAIGNYALQHVNADGNVAVGHQSGQNILSGINNTFIGTNSDVTATYTNLNNATAIGYNAKVTTSNTVQLGNSTVTHVKTDGKYTAGAVTYTNVDGVAGQFLQTDGNGNASFVGLPIAATVAHLDASMNLVRPQADTNTANITTNTNAIAALVNADTSTLALITDISNSLNNDANFSTTILAEIAKKIDKTNNVSIDGVKTFTSPIVGSLSGNATTATGFATQTTINNKAYYGQGNIILTPSDLGITYSNIATITSNERTRVAQIESLATVEARKRSNIKAAGALLIDQSEQQDVTGVKKFVDGIEIPAGKQLTGLCSTATVLTPGANINGKLFTGGANITLAATDLTGITNAGSGKIITDAERTSYNNAVTRLDDLLDDNGDILDSITEISTALNNNPNFATTITNLANTKMAKDGNLAENVSGVKTFLNELKANGGLTGNVTGNLTGNADTATGFATQTKINNKAYYGQGDITLIPSDLGITYSGVATITGTERSKLTNIATTVSDAITNTSLLNNGAILTTGAHSMAGKLTANDGIIIPTGKELTGNAETATALKTGANINGKLFTGAANINLTAADIVGITSAGSGAIITAAERTQITTNETDIQTNLTTINGHTSTLNTHTTQIGNLDGDTIKLTGNVAQSANGVKTFTSGIIVPTANGKVIQGNLQGNADTATALKGPNISICGVAFDGTSSITLSADKLSDVTSAGSGAIITTAERNVITNIDTTHVKIAGAQNITGVKTFDNGIIIPAGKELTGNSSTTTQLKTARTIAGVSFNGTQNIAIASHNLSDMTNDTTYTHSGKIITDAERTAISTNTTTITNNKNSLDTEISTLQQRATTLENDVVIKGDPAGATEQLISGIKKFTKKIIADAGIELGGNLHATVNYPTAYTAVTHNNVSSGGANPTVNVANLITALNNLSNSIATLSTAVQALNGKKVLN